MPTSNLSVSRGTRTAARHPYAPGGRPRPVPIIPRPATAAMLTVRLGRVAHVAPLLNLALAGILAAAGTTSTPNDRTAAEGAR